MGEREDTAIWAEAKARHEASDNKVRPWKAATGGRETADDAPAALTDEERNVLYDAVASEWQGKESI